MEIMVNISAWQNLHRLELILKRNGEIKSTHEFRYLPFLSQFHKIVCINSNNYLDYTSPSNAVSGGQASFLKLMVNKVKGKIAMETLSF